jgi:hypothetical protein
MIRQFLTDLLGALMLFGIVYGSMFLPLILE